MARRGRLAEAEARLHAEAAEEAHGAATSVLRSAAHALAAARSAAEAAREASAETVGVTTDRQGSASKAATPARKPAADRLRDERKVAHAKQMEGRAMKELKAAEEAHLEAAQRVRDAEAKIEEAKAKLAAAAEAVAAAERQKQHLKILMAIGRLVRSAFERFRPTETGGDQAEPEAGLLADECALKYAHAFDVLCKYSDIVL